MEEEQKGWERWIWQGCVSGRYVLVTMCVEASVCVGVCVIVDIVERDCGVEAENGRCGMRGGRSVATGNGF